MNTNVKEMIEKIEKQAETHSNEDRFVRTVQMGQIIRQGDIYVERVKDNISKGKETQELQLAPGTSKGSRHILVKDPGNLKVYENPTNDPLDGPIIQAKKRFALNHPEHPNFSIPSGTYKITYQRDFAMEERARVRD